MAKAMKHHWGKWVGGGPLVGPVEQGVGGGGGGWDRHGSPHIMHGLRVWCLLAMHRDLSICGNDATFTAPAGFSAGVVSTCN